MVERQLLFKADESSLPCTKARSIRKPTFDAFAWSNVRLSGWPTDAVDPKLNYGSLDSAPQSCRSAVW